MRFSMRTKVRFAQVDPAGIVFYPRYFDMLNAAVEDWFEQELGVDFATLHLKRRLGVPTVQLTSDFRAPSRLGDELEVSIEPVKVGRSSCTVRYTIAGCDQAPRLVADAVLVCMDLDAAQSTPWPPEIRAAMAAGLGAPDDVTSLEG